MFWNCIHFNEITISRSLTEIGCLVFEALTKFTMLMLLACCSNDALAFIVKEKKLQKIECKRNRADEIRIGARVSVCSHLSAHGSSIAFVKCDKNSCANVILMRLDLCVQYFNNLRFVYLFIFFLPIALFYLRFCFSYSKFIMVSCGTGEFNNGDTINFRSVLAVVPPTQQSTNKHIHSQR